MPGKLYENSTGSDVDEQVKEKVCGLKATLRPGTKRTAHLKLENDKFGTSDRRQTQCPVTIFMRLVEEFAPCLCFRDLGTPVKAEPNTNHKMVSMMLKYESYL